MKRLLFVAALWVVACSGPASKPAPEITQSVYRLYDGPAPGSEDWDWEEYSYTDERGETYFTNIKDPELVAFLPPKDIATGAAMIVCPGGSFRVNYYSKEGANEAQWLAEHGIAAFVLKYRLIHFARNEEEAFYEPKGEPAPVYTPEEKEQFAAYAAAARGLYNDDGRAAIAYVRAHAGAFGIDPDRIGMMGFSAGAMLTSDVALNHTPESAPNLVVPVYGAAFSLPEKLPEDAAPLFVCAPEFDLFRGLTGVDMVRAWKDAGLPAEAHYFAGVSHGYGYYPESDDPVYVWIDLLYAFMRRTGFLGPDKALMK
ncbi:MAG: alpha/beta hydrolase [Bacteroidales bacterium]|nr:alpha/beta hydrolase [Bacteroidales bacterium]